MKKKNMPDVFEKDGLLKYECMAKPFHYQAEEMSCGWKFIAFPQDMTKEIRENHQHQEEGWGRIKVIARVGGSEWKTSVWFDTKHDTYLLPLKAEVRKKEKIELDKDVTVIIWV